MIRKDTTPPVSGWEVTPAPRQELLAPRRRSRVLIPLLLTLLVAAVVPVTVMVLRNRTVPVSITSTPAGAWVTIDGTSRGSTPLTLAMKAGTYAVRVTKEGYIAHEEKLDIAVNGTGKAPLSIALTPTTATLSVTSTPAGAQVYLDGTSIGATPIADRTVTPGTHTLRLVLSGYDEYSTSLTLLAGDTKTTSTTLTKKLVVTTMSVSSSPSGAKVLLDSVSIGPTPITKKVVTPGTHSLRLTLPGYEDYSTSLSVQAGATKTVTASLTKKPVVTTLSVTSTPSGAKVFLDGTSIGTTPIVRKTITPGTHALRLTLPGYEDYSTSLSVQAGGTKTVTATLAKKAVVPTTGILTVTSTPSGAVVYFDDSYLGTTPIMNEDVVAGFHTLLFQLASYDDYSTSVFIQAGDTRSVAATLTRNSATGTLTITSAPSGARIYLDGEDTGKYTPATLALALGTHAVKLQKEGYLEYEGSAQFTTAGTSQTFSATLTAAPPALPAPQLLGPSSSSVVSSTPTLSWTPVAGASYYMVNVWRGSSNADRSDNTTVFNKAAYGSSITLPVGTLQAGTSYAWAVWAFRSTDPAKFLNYNISAVWRFTTAP